MRKNQELLKYFYRPLQSPQSILKKYWGYPAFRPLQEEIITSILEGKDTVALLPTGGGKSICYQVPAIAREGFAIVVSPLVALMQDQVSRLKKQGVLAAAIHGGMSFSEVKQTLDSFLYGPYNMLFVAPERLQTNLFKEYLPDFNVNLIAVDEAHCISQWGHDFRPNYLKIAELREYFPNVPVLALTASATPEVQQDILVQLKMKQPAVFRQSFERENIFYEIRYSENKIGDTLNTLKNNNACAIIYCRSRKQTETLSKTLQQNNLSALAYHAGMSKDKRDAAQHAWMNNEAQIMVATTAFGMGIDKPDVRLVLHYDTPEHLEAWYQEAGRAGRDGKPANTLTLYNYTDIKRLGESTALQFPPEKYLRQVYQSVAEYLQIATGMEPDQYYPFDLADFAAKFKLKALEANYALKLLEQDGLWTLTEAVRNPATIQFTATRQEIDHIYQHYKEPGYVAINLLRQYNGILQFPVAVRIGAVAKQLKMPQAAVERAIVQLHQMGILKYNQPKEGPQMFFHHYRVDSRHLIINNQRIQKLREQHEARTKAMIAFLEEKNICRDRILLRYFGEQPHKDCGHCDVCRNKQFKNTADINLHENVLQLIRQEKNLDIIQLKSFFDEALYEPLLTVLRELADRKLITVANNIISLTEK